MHHEFINNERSNANDMMIRSSRGKATIEAKQEDEADNNSVRTQSATAITRTSASSSSRQWSAFRNPRIFRVSKSFGGKDRHSKVCTVRGLRDRRIRLSVPTAIQLYDLQDRLGLTQPSKVIDWLLDATKNDIDNLPPLQMPQGFGQFHPQLLFPHETITPSSQIPPLVRSDEQELFPLASTNSSYNPPSMQLNNPYSYNWDSSNLSLSQFGIVPQQPENNSHSLNTSSTVSLPPGTAGGSQFFFCPPQVTLPSFFPQYNNPFANPRLENNETREISHFSQLLNSGFGNSQRNNDGGRQGRKDRNADQ